MKNFMLLLLLLKSMLLALTVNAQAQKDTITLSDNLEIVTLSPRVLLHVSYLETNDFGRVPCNGVVYLNQNEALIMDTPSNEAQSQLLYDWLLRTYPGLQVKGVVVNHFHADALGGLEVFHRAGIPSYGHSLTRELAALDSMPLPGHTFKKTLRLKVGNSEVLSHYFGEAHTKDNIVCWLPEERLIFGGCMVKSMDAGRGNLEHANTAEWANTVARVIKAHASVQTVVPGHGRVGGPELLMYTLNMFTPDKTAAK